jgi:predicted murein hydrolase (TIGR00659 family)
MISEIYLMLTNLQWSVVISIVLVTALTLAGYGFGLWCYRRSKQFSLLHPVPVAALLIAGLIFFTQLPINYYDQGCALLRWLLGPATVALALPLYQQLHKIRQLVKPLIIGVIFGSVVAMISAVFIAAGLDASDGVLRSLASKSVTTPISIAVAREIHGIIPLAAGAVIFTGIFGICIAPWIFRWCRVTDVRAKGFALGLAAHGIGTARALEDGPQSGAFATLALCLTGVFSSLLIPLLIDWLLSSAIS